MHSEKVTFPGSGGTPLAGRLDLPGASEVEVRTTLASADPLPEVAENTVAKAPA